MFRITHAYSFHHTIRKSAQIVRNYFKSFSFHWRIQGVVSKCPSEQKKKNEDQKIAYLKPEVAIPEKSMQTTAEVVRCCAKISIYGANFFEERFLVVNFSEYMVNPFTKSWTRQCISGHFLSSLLWFQQART